MTTQEIMTRMQTINFTESFSLYMESITPDHAEFIVKSDYMLGQMSDTIKWAIVQGTDFAVPVNAKTNSVYFDIAVKQTKTGLNVYRMNANAESIFYA